MDDQCAIGPDGKLKDALQIQWYRDADDETPVAGPSSDLRAYLTNSIIASLPFCLVRS